MASSSNLPTTLTVDNNNDSGRGSLREALKDSQKGEGDFDIVFDSDKEPNNKLTTGYFTIELKSSLPTIYRNNVTINQTNPRSVILVADMAANTPNRTTGKMSNDNPGGVNGSMLYVGDTNRLYPSYPNSTDSPPNVVINNVSFIRNQSKGGDGENGAGGGLGAGGGIALMDGSLTIRNSIFQDLTAVGGKGGEPARGGNGTIVMDSWINKFPSSGTSGGHGGLSTLPPRDKDEISGTLKYDTELAPKGGDGGAAGGTNKVCQGWLTNAEAASDNFAIKHIGKDGTRGENGVGLKHFGMGGGGGGAGGGGGSSYDRRASCWISPTSLIYQGGKGGPGGFASIFGGNGGKGEDGWSASGANLLNLGGSERDRDDEGSQGSPGEGHGNAIAIVGAEATLNLDQSNFYQSRISPEQNFIWSLYDKKLSTNQVFFGEDRHKRTKVEPGSTNKSFYQSHYGKGSIDAYKPTDTAPAFTGISVPRVPSVADFADTVLVGTDLADRFHVSFEDRSTVAGITSDLNDPNNPMNRIWRELVPDKKKEILATYQAKADKTWEEAIFTEDFAKERAFNILEDVIASSINTITAPINPTGVGGGAAGMAVSDFAKAQFDYVEEQVMMADVRDTALQENEDKQKQMQAALRDGSEASLSTVKLDLERTRVRIEDFGLGEDIVTFPKSGDAGIRFNLSRVKDDKVITFQYDTGSNKDLPFLEVELTDSSVDALGNANNASSIDVLESMLRNNGKEWMLGSRIVRPIKVSSTDASYGPGAATLIVDRAVKSLELDRMVNLITSQGDDQIFGTDGVENILSGRGDDMIFPGFGNDLVNGGPGSDLVSYAVRPMTKDYQPMPVSLKAIDAITINAQSLDAGVDGVSVLRNIENFHAYGSSNIDLRKLGKPKTNHYKVISGAGGNLIGSSFDDVISISFNPAWNGKVPEGGFKTTTVDGGDGIDTLVINSVKSEPKMKNIYVVHTGEDLSVVRVSGNKEFPLVVARGIEHIDSTTTLESRKSLDIDAIGNASNVSLRVDKKNVGHSRHTIQGTGTHDRIIGSSDHNEIHSGIGDDTVEGGFGNDLIIPGKGHNVLSGDMGNDRYRLSRKNSSNLIVVKSGDEEIVNFNPENDLIAFANIQELKFSSSPSLKESKRSNSNIVIKPDKNILRYRNDGSTKFNSVRFERFDIAQMNSMNLMDLTTLSSLDVIFL